MKSEKTAKFTVHIDLVDGEVDGNWMAHAIENALNRSRNEGQLTPENDDHAMVFGISVVHEATV